MGEDETAKSDRSETEVPSYGRFQGVRQQRWGESGISARTGSRR
jgi:hypothetical protein